MPDLPAPTRIRIAVTLGDPRGIGPEIAVRAALEPKPLAADIVLVGPTGAVDTLGLELISVGSWSHGAGESVAGELAAAAIRRAVELTRAGDAQAIVTAPISKPALAAAGYRWPGHTEMLRDLTGARMTALCLASETSPLGSPLRVVLVTGHMALREVPAAFTLERLCATARLAGADLRRLWGIAAPRLAVCGLNPHASDRGLFGDEEARISEPAISRLREEGLDASGPYPADTVFIRAMRGEFDAVLTPYHDVGMTAIKTACFGGAVNVTLGLPFPRTAPDHGTAFDIAGAGVADPASMRAALELALRLGHRALTSRSLVDRLAGG